jgi:hypothetical protein
VNDSGDDTIPVGKIVLWFMAIFLFLTALGWLSNGLGLLEFNFFGPKWADAQTRVYNHTQAKVSGDDRRLGELCSELKSTDANHASMIESMIAHEYADKSTDDVPDYLRDCLTRARAAQ